MDACILDPALNPMTLIRRVIDYMYLIIGLVTRDPELYLNGAPVASVSGHK
jgi:hypothetical protein